MGINKKCIQFDNTKGVFRTQLNIYDEVLLEK